MNIKNLLWKENTKDLLKAASYSLQHACNTISAWLDGTAELSEKKTVSKNLKWGKLFQEDSTSQESSIFADSDNYIWQEGVDGSGWYSDGIKVFDD